MAFGAPYMSREWFTNRRPYAWSLAPDCTMLTELIADYGEQARLRTSRAVRRRRLCKDKTRKVAIIAPDNPEYQQCVDVGRSTDRKRPGHVRGARVVHARHREPVEPGGEPRREAVEPGHHDRRVRLRPDPAGLPDGEGARAGLVPGVARARHGPHRHRHRRPVLRPGGVDPRVRRQRARRSAAAPRQPRLPRVQVGAEGRTRRRASTSSTTSLLVAIGIHMAGPNLTPETFEKGMFAYPGGNGPIGTMGVRTGRLHADGRRARDLVGPGRDLDPERRARRVPRSNGKRYGDRRVAQAASRTCSDDAIRSIDARRGQRRIGHRPARSRRLLLVDARVRRTECRSVSSSSARCSARRRACSPSGSCSRIARPAS